MDAKNPPTLSAPALGQLLLMQSVLCNLPDEKSIFSFVCRGLLDLPGVAEASFSETAGKNADASLIRFPLQIGSSNRGELSIKVSDPCAFAPYEAYLQNFCFMLAVILEERHQRRINEQHQAQLEQRVAERTADLRESEERFRVLFEQAAVGVAQIRSDNGRFIRIKQKYCDIVGYSRKEMERLDFQTITHPDDLAGDLANMDLLKAGKIREFTMEKRYFRRDGSIVWVNLTVSPMWSPDEPPGCHVAVVEDVTERKRAEEALRESEEKYRLLIENTNAGVFQTTLSGSFVQMNSAVAEMSGYESVSELMAKPASCLYANPADRERLKELLLRDGQVRSMEVRAVKKDGTNQWVCLNAVVQRDKDGKPDKILGVVNDITDRKRAEEALRASEERLRQAEKMTAIGQLAGGVAHDFNNQLTGIMGYADLLAQRLEDERLRNFAQGIVIASRRASDLTQQLLAFSRKGKYLSVPVDVHKLLDEVVAILDRTVDKRIRISRLLRANHPVVIGDPSQIQNALLNVALNARDAMPQGGEVVLETDVIAVDAEFCRNNPYEITPGPYSCVSITDTGSGMTDEVKKRLFEPFFTTKKPGQGTGMGLASVYGAVRNHRGAISILSEVGRGTTVRIYLPLAPGASEPEQAIAEAAPVQGTAWILLVDDEAIIRQMATEMLRGLGFGVETCANGREAVEYYRANWQQVDLVILDMAMPEMGGRDTFLAMRQINPQIRALLSSGYSLNEEAQGILNEGVLGFVAKPYGHAELSRRVAEALLRK